MFLHIGQSVTVREEEVIGVFDLDNTTGSAITRDFLKRAQDNGEVISMADELPKSFVVARGKAGLRIYLSQLSTMTLVKRGGGLPSAGGRENIRR